MIMDSFKYGGSPRSTLYPWRSPVKKAIVPRVLVLAGVFRLVSLSMASAVPVISEIMASNQETITDEDGETPDWVEIYNPDAEVVDLGGWHLTDSAANPRKWTFPAGTVLAPGEFLLVWASGKDRAAAGAPLHTNFSLSADGEYLALVAPDGVTKSTEFSPSFPPLREDESHGLVFEGVALLAPGADARTRVPVPADSPDEWKVAGFVPGAGWVSGPTPVGFGMLTPGFFIEERRASVFLGDITTAEAVLNGVNALDYLTGIRPVVNFVGGGDDARFDNGMPTLHGGDQENYAIRATGTLVIPNTGPWTFHVNSDDGFRLRIDGQQVMVFEGGRGPGDSFGTRTLSAGTHFLELTYFEGGGGDEVELSAAPGTHTSFSAALFRLIGDTANGGLTILTAPTGGGTGSGQAIRTDIGGAMRNVNASAWVRVPFTVSDPAAFDTLDLIMGYNDGFVAWLNGTEVARRNAPALLANDSAAPAVRGTLESLRSQHISISAHRPVLVAGTNVLAIQGLNVSADDSSFYIAPELSAAVRKDGPMMFFAEATPGGANTTPASLGRVRAPEFSVQRGYYESPQQVVLTSATPQATIRYTVDGSTPTRTHGIEYTGPITVPGTTVLRAVAYREGYEDTPAVTHTYLFPEDVIRQGVPSTPGWPAGNVNGQEIDYGMDQSIVNHSNPQIGGPQQTIAALRAIPSVCISTDLPNLFHPSTGIYVNAGSRGRSWERAASVEMIGDVNTEEGGFGSGCGIRIRGGYSRSSGNPKHSFRLFFRREYGAGKLNYPVFGSEGASEFDAFDIQCSQNYSWSFEGSSSHNALREVWSRDTQLDLGHLSTRGRFVHLYLNGVYWGLYQIQERAEASFGATYLGGDPDDFDVVKAAGPSGGYTTEATDGYFTTLPDGSPSAWRQLWEAARACYFIHNDRNPANPSQVLPSSPEEKRAAYFRVIGLLPDGRTRDGNPLLVDIDNLIDYVMLLFFTRNTDSGISAFLGNERPNNFYTLRDRTGMTGFLSIAHDAEHSLDAGSAGDRWGPWNDPYNGAWNDINYSNPQYLHQDLSASPEYRMRFADRIYRHFFNEGPMTVAANQARLDRRAAEIEPAIIAESARWGDSRRSPALNADNWRTARNSTRNWFSGRNAQFLNEARARGFYPAIDPPVFNQRGGEVPAGFEVVLTNPNPGGGTIHYTLDGSDPRPVDAVFTSTVLVPEFSDAQYFVPTSTNGGSALTAAQWTGIADPPNAGAWSSGQLGFGYAPQRSGSTDFRPFIRTDLRDALQRPGGGVYASVYVRLPFTVTAEQIGAVDSMRLKVRYEDGFIAYLNGQEVARGNIDAQFQPSWNSYAPALHDDSAAVVQETITLSGVAGLLVPGTNVLAFHVMNINSTSTDLLFSPQVEYETLISGGTPGTPYTGPFPVSGVTTVKARVLQGSTWSALNEAVFSAGVVKAGADNLVISEFAYAPAGPRLPAEAGFEGRDFEFIELHNPGALAVSLEGAAFTAGITYAFTGPVIIPPGGYLVLVSNPAAYAARYPDAPPPAGAWEGNLNNAGETVTLTGWDGSIIREFTYSPLPPWPAVADGGGPTLVLIDPASMPDHSDPANWRPSSAFDGTPGAEDTGEPPPPLTGYAAWREANGNPAEDDDSDGDGLTAFAEYALGGSLTRADTSILPAVSLVSGGPDGGQSWYPALTFARPAGADDVDYVVEAAADPASGPWQTAAAVTVSETPRDDGMVEVTIRTVEPVTPGEAFFLRLKMSLRQ